MKNLFLVILLSFVCSVAAADSMNVPRLVQTCPAYRLIPKFFRVPVLRNAILERLEELESPREVIVCSGNVWRLREADKAIVKLCKQGIDLDSAAHSIITLHVASCYMDNE